MNLNLKNLQAIQTQLHSILEKHDHPCRYAAAELLLKVQHDDISNLEGLPHYEEELEKAILDPLSTQMESTNVEIVKMKQNTTWQADNWP